MSLKELPRIIPNISLTEDLRPELYRHPRYMREGRDFFMLKLENGDLKNTAYLEELDNSKGKGAGVSTLNALKWRKDIIKSVQNLDEQWDKDNVRLNPLVDITTDFNLMKAYNHRKVSHNQSISHWELFLKEHPHINANAEVEDASDLAKQFREFSLRQAMEENKERYVYQCQMVNKPATKEGLEEYAKTKIFWTLRRFQPVDAWYIANSKSLLITHQMRLGKTGIVATALWNKLNITKKNNLFKKDTTSGVIIAPKSTLHGWKSTMDLWTYNNVKSEVWSADVKKKEQERILQEWIDGDINYLIVNYDFFVNRREFIERKGKIDMMVIDEAHFLGNRTESATMPFTSKRSKSLMDYRINFVEDVLLLTGTPTQKKEHEIFSLYHFLYPNNREEVKTYHPTTGKQIRTFRYDGEPTNNYKYFFERFVRIEDTPKRENGFVFKTKNNNDYDDLFKEVSLLHRIHRTTSDEIDSKGMNIHENVVIKMKPSQLKLYDTLSDMVQTMFLKTDNPLVRDTYLRQIAVDHRLVKPNFMKAVDQLFEDSKLTDEAIQQIMANTKFRDEEHYKETLDWYTDKMISAKTFLSSIFKAEYGKLSEDEMRGFIEEKLDDKYKFKKEGTKTEWLMSWLKENKESITSTTGSPIVIFSQFTTYLYMIREQIEKLGFSVDMLVGSGPESKGRKEKESKFQAGLTNIMLANIAANREGVTLNRANQAIFMDRVFSNKDMMQVTERINNPESMDIKSTLFVMCEDTIDFKVEEFNKTYDENTRYANEHAMNDITQSGAKSAKEMFEEYLLKNIKEN